MINFKDFGVGLLIAALTKLATDLYVGYRDGLRNLGSCPGKHRLWVQPFHTSGIVLASIFPPRGWMAHYAGKFSLYAKEGSTILSAIFVWGVTPMFWLADAEAIKMVTSDRHTFRKEVEVYDVLEIYGKNLVTTEGDEWRRHLAIAAPAFNEANYALAWSETLRVMQEWFKILDEDSSALSGKKIDVKDAMTRLTLLIVSAAGFGKRESWSSLDLASEVTGSSQNGIMPFHTALELTIERLSTKVLTPEFVYALPFKIPWLSGRLREARDAFASLRAHMEDLVMAARSSDSGGADLLMRLVKANEATRTADGAGAKGTLSDEELFSNIFVFLLAGHETSAHTLCFALLLLALYPETQRKLRAELLRVWPTPEDCASSSKRDFDKLEYTLAVFRETLRCFPPEPRINKIVENDTILTGTRFHTNFIEYPPSPSYDGGLANIRLVRDESKDSKFSVHVPKGSAVTMDIWALHMNPLHWGDDAHLFKPERFIDTPDYKWPRDAFLPFSAGARGCIGKTFAITESVCLLACLGRRYEILLPDGMDGDNLTELDKRKLLAWRGAITTTPTNAFVRLRRYPTE